MPGANPRDEGGDFRLRIHPTLSLGSLSFVLHHTPSF